MPRLYLANNDIIDFCRECWPESVEDAENGYGPNEDHFEYDAEHPDYAGEYYHCDICDKSLTSHDNGTFWRK